MSEKQKNLVRRAMQAANAAVYLQEHLGLEKPISKQQMWALARAKVIPAFHIGRKVYFLSTDLDSYIAVGGASYAKVQ